MSRPLTVCFTLIVLVFCACRQPVDVADGPQETRQIATSTAAPSALARITVAASSPSPTSTVAATATAVPSPLPVPTHTPTPSPSPTPAFPVYEGPALDLSSLGIQLHIHREDQDQLFAYLEQLPLGWVKVQVSWKVYEPEPGRYDDFRFGELDSFVQRANDHGLNVLLGVAKAPEWSRPTTEFDGPPSNPAHFQIFMEVLARRYRGQVAAYELWNEPNLQREWYGQPLSAEATVALIAAGAAGVRTADPDAVLVGAAPATTGIDDGVIAIDDRRFLREMLAAGLAGRVDAVGVHPYGWANPAAASVAAPDPVAPTHNNHRSFFFADTLRDYRQLLDGAGYPGVPLWVTEFGWATFDRLGAEPPPGAEFMNHVDEWQQAEYTLEALAITASDPLVGPLFLWNLNFGPTLGTGFAESGYSILRSDGSRRPLFHALAALDD